MLPTAFALHLLRLLAVSLCKWSMVYRGSASGRGPSQASLTASRNPLHCGQMASNRKRRFGWKSSSNCSSKGTWSEHQVARACREQHGKRASQSTETKILSIRSRVGCKRSLLQVKSRLCRCSSFSSRSLTNLQKQTIILLDNQLLFLSAAW